MSEEIKQKYKKVVDVPEVDKDAYNHDRPISALIFHQLRHMRDAERNLPERQRTGTDISKIHTERQASEYIAKVTAKLHSAKRPKRPAKQTPTNKHAGRRKTR